MAVIRYLVAAVALVCLLPISHQNEIKEARLAMVKECQNKTGASDADIAALRARKTPESKEGICMFECLFNNAKVMQDGKLDKEGLVTALTPMVGGDEAKVAKLKEMAETCGKELEGVTGDKCDIGHKLLLCTVEKGKAFGFEYPCYF